MARKTTDILIEKTVHALISSIEIYNKPDFKYREENFVILLTNSWELLLKAKIIANNNNDKKSIYIKHYPKNKDGSDSKRWEYKTTDAGSYWTKNIAGCINVLQTNNFLDEKVVSNLKSLLEIRNSSIHYYNVSTEFVKNVHEISSASIYSLISYLDEWFGYSLNKYNLYLLPLSFLGSSAVETDLIFTDEIKLLKFINIQKKKYPYEKSDSHHYSFQIKISLTKKSKGNSSVYLSNDPSAPKVYLSDEELKKRYPLTFDEFVTLCEKRYSDFVRNQKFYDLKAKYESDLKYCYPRSLNLNGGGSIRKYYSTAILNEFDKVYEKK